MRSIVLALAATLFPLAAHAGGEREARIWANT
jgi:hypothetical protein